MKTAAITLVLLCTALSLGAQGTEKVLFPVIATEHPGAFGTKWGTLQFGRHVGVQALDVRFDRLCSVPCGQELRLEPESASVLVFEPSLSGQLLVAPLDAPIDYSLHLLNVTGSQELPVTQLPVVREREFFSRALSVLGIPLQDRFRYALRVYDISGVPFGRVRVTARSFLPVETQPVFGQVIVQLAPGADDLKPAYAAVTDFSALFPILTPDVRGRVYLEIEPLDAGMKIWAFVTIVDNQTQHVTVYAPQ